MVRKAGTCEARIKDFTSLADHDASIAKEGQVTLLKFDTYIIRRIIHNGEPFYSVVDAVGALAETQAKDAGAYWRKLKQRLMEEGADQFVTNCHELKLPAADGKGYRTDCANIETMFRIIQSIPSKKAEPFKQWLAKVGFERVRETAEPSRMARRMVQTYRDLGAADNADLPDRIRRSRRSANPWRVVVGLGSRAPQHAPYAATQFSARTPGMRANSRILLVTTISPSLRAWPPICMSCGPQGPPARSRSARRCPQCAAAFASNGSTCRRATKRSSSVRFSAGRADFSAPK